MKKIICLISVITIIFSICPAVFADVALQQDVSEEMCSADYWKARTVIDCDEILMTADDIRAYNRNAVDSTGTYVVGVEYMKETYNADYLRRIMHFDVPSRNLYINGEKIDNTEYYNKINDAILNTGYTETEKATEYTVAIRQTDMKYIPTKDVIGYSATDTDDEMEYENISVNEPFVVRQMCIIDGVKYYYGYTTDCVGWVPAEDFALFRSKEEWLDAWYNEIDGDDFIVVTQDKLTLERSLWDKDSDDLKLTLGTTLKLIPEDEIPEKIDGRNTWNNYAVYIPTKDDEGYYVKKPALISQHYSISVGYLPFTQANLLDVAFSCLGNRYGWAGMLDAYDCSLYTRSVYRCFGLTYPRNCTWQQNVSGTKIDMSAMTDTEKQQFLETLPSGTALFISGHTMIYLGTENGTSYVISALGTVVDSSGSDSVKYVYNTAITPLTVRRGASYGYTTWLHNLTSAVTVMPGYDISKCTVTAKKDCNTDEITVSVSAGKQVLYENVNYTVEITGGNVTVSGINYYTGSVTVTAVKHSDSDGDGFCDLCNENISGKKFIKLINFIKRIFSLIKNLFNII